MLKILLALVLATLPLLTPAQETKAQAKPEDVKSPDAIIAALYDTISGPAGQKRDWDRLRSLFAQDGRMMIAARRPTGETALRTLTVQGYIDLSGKFLEERGFFEKEVARKTEAFANIVHAFSTYEARSKKEDEKPFMRGINSIQLMNDGKRWWIVTVFWQQEDAQNPLPEKYLKPGG